LAIWRSTNNAPPGAPRHYCEEEADDEGDNQTVHKNSASAKRRFLWLA